MPQAKIPAMSTRPSRDLETFPNPRPGRAYEIAFEAPEFTCVCPKTGQPDFATIRIRYVPDESCVELKSLKLYLWSYRDEGAFHEDVTNRILDDLVVALDVSASMMAEDVAPNRLERAKNEIKGMLDGLRGDRELDLLDRAAVGGGIVLGSDAGREVMETQWKAVQLADD